MKCTFCDNTNPDMPTILEFLGVEGVASTLETGICEECQKLPLDEFSQDVPKPSSGQWRRSSQLTLRGESPPVRDDERQRIFMFRTDVDEMNVDHWRPERRRFALYLER